MTRDTREAAGEAKAIVGGLRLAGLKADLAASAGAGRTPPAEADATAARLPDRRKGLPVMAAPAAGAGAARVR